MNNSAKSLKSEFLKRMLKNSKKYARMLSRPVEYSTNSHGIVHADGGSIAQV